jgi:hypothetical protein
MSHLTRVVLTVAFSAALVGQSHPPERKVEGNIVTSARDPEVRIEFPRTAQYVGADRWVLYEIADCELHAFVDADAQKRVQRLYWLQFESYVPSRPELHHTYNSPRHASLGGMDFYLDTWVAGRRDRVSKGSDLEHIRALVRGKGYKLPSDMMSVRLVHLLDERRRKELMIIYSEGLGTNDQWPAVEQGLITRALERVTVQRR